MTPNAIFYGGTDPGRFVPTYMIYSADVRPDVYLITQNALADNTYMNVMRDLYGDTIWIPSLEDSNEAFRKYVDDVNAGRIPAGADIKIENGKVSVQGVGGVMTINGILAELIFEENKAKHDFYVEESYVIRWMYPYLTPHGLIMKLNRSRWPSLDPEAGGERPQVLGLVHEVAAGPARSSGATSARASRSPSCAAPSRASTTTGACTTRPNTPSSSPSISIRSAPRPTSASRRCT